MLASSMTIGRPFVDQRLPCAGIQPSPGAGCGQRRVGSVDLCPQRPLESQPGRSVRRRRRRGRGRSRHRRGEANRVVLSPFCGALSFLFHDREPKNGGGTTRRARMRQGLGLRCVFRPAGGRCGAPDPAGSRRTANRRPADYPFGARRSGRGDRRGRQHVGRSALRVNGRQRRADAEYALPCGNACSHHAQSVANWPLRRSTNVLPSDSYGSVAITP